MPVWLSLFIAVAGTVGFFFAMYFVVIGAVEGKRAKGKPRLGIGSGSRPGTFSYWITWDTGTYNLQVYRLRVALYNPNGEPKDGVFTITYDPVNKAPYQQEVEFPAVFAKVLESQQSGKKGIITIDVRTVDEQTLPVDFSFEKMRRIFQGQGKKAPKMDNVLPVGKMDPPPVMSLDYSELVVRRKKIRDLEAAAKAKAAKAPPKVAAAAGAPAPAPTAAAPVAPALKAAPAAAAPAAAPAPVAKPAPAAAAPAPAPAPAEKPAAKPVAAAPAPAPAPADKPAAAKPPEDKPAGAKPDAAVPSIKSVIAKANAEKKDK